METGIKEPKREFGVEDVDDRIVINCITRSDLFGRIQGRFNGTGWEQRGSDAGEIAGFDAERIVSEPTAVAMADGIDEDENKTILVYDISGGTFGVSILNIGGGVSKVAATNGDNDLGGGAWDEAIIDYLAEESLTTCCR